MRRSFLLPAEKKSWKMWQIVLSQQAVKLIQSVVMSVSEKIATELQRKQERNTVASMCLSTMQVSVTNRCLLQDAVMTGGDRLSQSIRILYSTCQEQPLFIWKNGVKALSSIFLPSAVYLQTQVLLTVQQKQPLWL